MDFDKVIYKMKKKWQKLWSIRDIEKQIMGPDWASVKKTQLYKCIYHLIATWVLVSFRKWMYFWNLDGKLYEEDFYWEMIKKLISENHLWQGVMIGEKVLALGLRDFSIPEKVFFAVPENGTTSLLYGSNKLITFDLKGRKSLFSLVKKYATKITLDGIQIMATAPEHAILESLMARPGVDINDTQILDRWLKKYHESLREEVFAQFLIHKYISAVNRLKYIAFDSGYDDLYKMMVRLIDIHGKGCHLSRDFLFWKHLKKI